MAGSDFSYFPPFDPPASPGFLWSGAGVVNAGSFLKNAEIPSNNVGLLVSVANGELKEVFVNNKSNNTFTIEIMYRSGASYLSFSTPAVVTVSAARGTTATFTGINLSLGDELVCKVTSGSGEDIIVAGQIKRAS
jgi:hypothetical protein